MADVVEGILHTKQYKTFTVEDQTIAGAVWAGHALPGDRVRVSGGRVLKILERAQHTNLVGVLELSGKALYGFTSRGIPIYLFVPWNESYPPFYIGSSQIDTRKNVVAVVNFESWEAGSNCPRGSCRQILGPCGDLETEEAALLIHACPNPWKKEHTLPMLICPENTKGEPIGFGHTFNIDPPGCRDIDDAITLWVDKDYLVHTFIHIANVATLLEKNKWLWRAGEHGQSLYRDGAVVAGMLPSFVESACSLLPNETRRTLSLSFIWDSITHELISEPTFTQEIISVDQSYTYDTIYGTVYADVLKEVVSGLAGREVRDSHEWISELMLLYNRQAAAILREHGEGVLRRHSGPDRELMESLEKLGTVPKFLAFSAGEYCAAATPDVRHWGLNTDAYCHATSPIRRWADCINQATLIQLLFNASATVPTFDIERMNVLASKAKRYERDLFFVRTLLQTGIWSSLGGTVVSGRKVWIEDWQRLVTVDHTFQPGDKVKIKAYMNPQQRNWKRRMVLELKLVAAAPTALPTLDFYT